MLQAGLFLGDFFLRDFTLMLLKNSHHFSDLRDEVWFNALWRRDAIIFSLTRLGMDEMWLHLSCVGG